MLCFQVNYIASSPQQQRNAEALSTANPPSVVTLVIPGCDEDLCPWETFVNVALGVIDMKCVQQPLQSSAESMMPNEDGSDGKGPASNDAEVVLITIAVCVIVLGSAFYLFRHYELTKMAAKRHEERHSYQPVPYTPIEDSPSLSRAMLTATV